MTKWVLDKEALTEEALLKYMKSYVTVKGKVKITVKALRIY